MLKAALICSLFLTSVSLPVYAFNKTSCNVGAYINDPDPKGLNVRLGPGTHYKVLKRLQSDHGVPPMIKVAAKHGLWFQITEAHNIETNLIFKGPGWVYAPLLATSTRSTSGMHTALYRTPSKVSPLKHKIPALSQVTLLSCQGNWLKVQYKNQIGWLSPQEQCPNPVTTCP